MQWWARALIFVLKQIKVPLYCRSPFISTEHSFLSSSQQVTSFPMPTRLYIFPQNRRLKNKMIDFAHYCRKHITWPTAQITVKKQIITYKIYGLLWNLNKNNSLEKGLPGDVSLLHHTFVLVHKQVRHHLYRWWVAQWQIVQTRKISELNFGTINEAGRTKLLKTVLRIWIRILLSPSKNSKKNLDSYCFVTSCGLFIFEKLGKFTFS
jgi:hypothetical protein